MTAHCKPRRRPSDSIRALSLILFTMLLLQGCFAQNQEEPIVQNIEKKAKQLGVMASPSRLLDVAMEGFRFYANKYPDVDLARPAFERGDDYFKIQSWLGLFVIEIFSESLGRNLIASKDLADIKVVIPKQLTGIRKFFPLKASGQITAEEIKVFYDSLIERLPNDRRPLRGLSYLYLVLQDWDQALFYAEEILEDQPKDELALKDAIIALFNKDPQDERFRVYRERYRKLVDGGFQLEYRLSLVARERKDLDLAIDLALGAAERVRGIEMTNHLASLYEAQGNLERSRYYKSHLLGMSKYVGKPVYDYAEKEIDRLALLEGKD